MMPTMPQKTLNTMIGMAEAPMVHDDFGSEVNNSEDDEDGCCHLLKLGPPSVARALQTIRDIIEKLWTIFSRLQVVKPF